LETLDGEEESNRDSHPSPRALKFWGENHHEITVVAPTGYDRMTSWLEVDFGGVGLAIA